MSLVIERNITLSDYIVSSDAGKTIEMLDHVFFVCPYARSLGHMWCGAPGWWRLSHSDAISEQSNSSMVPKCHNRCFQKLLTSTVSKIIPLESELGTVCHKELDQHEVRTYEFSDVTF